MPDRQLDRRADQPLWKQLEHDLAARLREGEFNHQFPGELTLVAEYGVSRSTVRQALRQLRADKRIVAERGRQPRVAEPPEIQQPLGALYSLFASVEAAGISQHSVVRALDTRADALVAERLGLEASTPLVYLERLRLAGDQPLALDRVWLPAALAAPLLSVDFSHTSLYGELAARVGLRLERGEETIHAINPTDAERTRLRCPPGAAAFSINRLGHTHDRPVEWRHTLIRGDRYALSAEFTATIGYRLTQPTLPA